MAKTVRLEPIAQESSVETNGNLLSVLLNKNLDVLKEWWWTWHVCHLPYLCSGGGRSANAHQSARAAHVRSHYLVQSQFAISLSG